MYIYVICIYCFFPVLLYILYFSVILHNICRSKSPTGLMFVLTIFDVKSPKISMGHNLATRTSKYFPIIVVSETFS